MLVKWTPGDITNLNFQVGKNRPEEAVISLKWFRGVENVDNGMSTKVIVDELKSIVVSTSEGTSDPISLHRTVEQIFGPCRKPFLIISTLIILIPFASGSFLTFFAFDTFAR